MDIKLNGMNCTELKCNEHQKKEKMNSFEKCFIIQKTWIEKLDREIIQKWLPIWYQWMDLTRIPIAYTQYWAGIYGKIFTKHTCLFV